LADALLTARACVNPSEAAQCAIDETYQGRDPGLAEILQIWAQADPQGAVDFAVENRREKRLGTVCARWLSQDREAAMAKLAAMDAKSRDEIVGAVMYVEDFLYAHPEIARKLLDAFPSPDAKKQRVRYAQFFYNRALVNPQETLSQSMALPEGALRTRVLAAVLQQIAFIDPASALDILRRWSTTAGEKERRTVLSSTLLGLCRSDPLGALVLLQEVPSSRDMDQTKIEMMRNLRPEDFPKAQQILERMTFYDAYARKRAFSQLGERIYSHNPKMAIAWLDQLGDQEVKSAVAQSILTACAKRNLSQATDLYTQFTQGRKIPLQISDVLDDVKTIPDIPAVFQWARKNLTGRDLEYTLPSLVDRAARENPAQALELLNELPEGSLKDNASGRLVWEIYNHSPQEAMAMATAFGNEDIEEQIRGRMLKDSVKGDFYCALQFICTPEGIDALRREAKDSWRNQSAVMNSLVSIDSAQVRVAIESLPDGVREQMLGFYASGIFETDPSQAVDILAEQLPKQGRSPFFASFMAWSAIDASAAMRWLEETAQDNSPLRDCVQPCFSAWLNQDIVAASQWLTDYPVGNLKDSMAHALINSVRDKDPEGAFSWAMALPEEGGRQYEIRTILEIWKKTDPQAACAAFENANLSANERKMISGGVMRNE